MARLTFIMFSLLALPALALPGDDPFHGVCGGLPGASGGPPAGLSATSSSLLGVCLVQNVRQPVQTSAPENPSYSRLAVEHLRSYVSHLLTYLHARTPADRDAARASGEASRAAYEALRSRGALVFATQAAAAAAYHESSRQLATSPDGSPEHALARFRAETALKDFEAMATDPRNATPFSRSFEDYLEWKRVQLIGSRGPGHAGITRWDPRENARKLVTIYENQLARQRSAGEFIYPSWAAASEALAREKAYRGPGPSNGPSSHPEWELHQIRRKACEADVNAYGRGLFPPRAS